MESFHSCLIYSNMKYRALAMTLAVVYRALVSFARILAGGQMLDLSMRLEPSGLKKLMLGAGGMLIIARFLQAP